jgi:hypothetical protein
LAEARLSEAQVQVARSATLFERALSARPRATPMNAMSAWLRRAGIARLRLRLLQAGTREEEVAEARRR